MSWTPCPDPTPGNAASVDAIRTVIVPRAVDLGEMEVRRALPSKAGQMVGPFIFFDQMGPAEFLTDEGIDVRPHPHINLATLTYLFEGEIRHRDSLGTDMAIQPGAVNWMRAGRGIVHSERTSEERRAQGQRLFGLQTWLALPAHAEETNPDFVHHGADDLPMLNAEGIHMRLIAGSAHGQVSPLDTLSDTIYADIMLDAGARFEVEPTYVERALYTILGRVEVTGRVFEPGQLLILHPGESVTVTAKAASRFMVFGGEPMDGPRHIWWNFVSSRPERIEQAKEEWRTARFDTVPGDVEEFIPLPEALGRPRTISPYTADDSA